MSSNEGPKRSDFKEAAALPACGAHCEHQHGDTAFSEDELELFRLRAAGLCASCSGVGMVLADRVEICAACKGSGRRLKTEVNHG